MPGAPAASAAPAGSPGAPQGAREGPARPADASPVAAAAARLAAATGGDAGEAERRVASLSSTLPGPAFAAAIAAMDPQTLDRLTGGSHLGAVTQRVVRLRFMFPRTDIPRLVARHKALLLADDFEAVEAGVGEVLELLELESVAELEAVLKFNVEVLDARALKGVLRALQGDYGFTPAEAVAGLRDRSQSSVWWKSLAERGTEDLW